MIDDVVKQLLEEKASPGPQPGPFGRHLNDGTPYVSPSQITTLMRCPASWKYRYLDGLVEPPNLNTFFGKYAHHHMERMVIERDLGALLKPEEEAQRVHDEALQVFAHSDVLSSLKEGREVDEEGKPVIVADDLARQLKFVILNIGVWLQKQQQMHPLRVEEGVRYDLDVLHRRVAIYGKPDWYGVHNGRHVVYDWKFPNKRPTVVADTKRVIPKLDYVVSVLLYAKALITMGHPVDAVGIVHAPRKSKESGVFISELNVTQDNLAYAEMQATTAIRKVLAGALEPNPVGAGWKCCPEYCHFFSMCPGSVAKVGLVAE